MPELDYQPGFGNDFSTEAIDGALPVGRNSPQRAPLGLYAEQLSGTAFTMPRSANRRSWLYRIRPGVTHSPFEPMDAGLVRGTPFDDVPPSPDQLRWDPISMPSDPTDFVDGLTTICGNGSINGMTGMAAIVYVANKSMDGRFFYNADGEMLLVPEMNRIRVVTEFGIIEIGPGEIGIVQRGIRFRVELPDGNARGYICENYGALLRPPDLGPIGANGLANPRDFLTPVAAFEDVEGDFELVTKYHGRLFKAAIDHSPIDVVAWHGNYAPYKYDLARFNTINTVSFDHPDPSIFTVLTSPTDTPGTANVDFVIFPLRWMVAENTFRPPYYHRNIMSEYMGLVSGAYDAKSEGFLPGGGSLHNCMSGHGPDAETFENASNAKLEPQYQGDTLAFMFETRYALVPTKFAMETSALQKDYLDCWKGLHKHFGS